LIAVTHGVRLARVTLRLWLVPVALATGCLSYHRGAMSGEPKDATFVEVEGARVRYLDVGPKDGEPVVLIHGFASSLETWEGVVPELVASGHRVLAMDLKGFGWTDRPPGDYSPDAQAKLVLALMDARGIQRAAVVGHSWGASVALAMALDAPERVSRLALYDAWAFEEQLPTFFLWARASVIGETLFWLFYDQESDERISLAFYDRKLVDEKLVEAVERALDRPGTKAAALAAVRGQRYRRMQKKYPTIAQPVLLLWGREDTVTPVGYGEKLARLLPHARLLVYPRCGHFPMIEALGASTAELLAFLAEAPRELPAAAPAAQEEPVK
jgi:pimeloyl-ACP methyl ester carboxylesterase